MQLHLWGFCSTVSSRVYLVKLISSWTLHTQSSEWVREWWMFMPYQKSSKVIFMAKTSFYIFSLRREDFLDMFSFGWLHLWDEDCVRVRAARDQNLRSFLLYFNTWWTQHQPGIEPQRPLASAGYPLWLPFTISRGYWSFSCLGDGLILDIWYDTGQQRHCDFLSTALSMYRMVFRVWRRLEGP